MISTAEYLVHSHQYKNENVIGSTCKRIFLSMLNKNILN